MIFLKLKKLCGPPGNCRNSAEKSCVLSPAPPSGDIERKRRPLSELGNRRRSLTGISRGSASARSPSHARHRSVPVSIVSSFGTVRERDIMCRLRGWLFHGQRPSRARRRPIPAGSGPASAVRKPPVVAMAAVRPGRSRATPLFSPPSLHLKVCQSCYCPQTRFGLVDCFTFYLYFVNFCLNLYFSLLSALGPVYSFSVLR